MRNKYSYEWSIRMGIRYSMYLNSYGICSLERECERAGLRIDAALLGDERLLERAFLADEATAAAVLELVAALASFDQVLNECFALYEPQKLHLYCAQLTYSDWFLRHFKC